MFFTHNPRIPYVMKIKEIVCLTAIGMLMAMAITEGQIAVSEGEVIQFQDDFSDNSNGWTKVAIVNGVGVATSGQAQIANGIWKPSVDSDGSGVSSVVRLSTLNLLDGPISIYMRVRVEDILYNPANARYGITLVGPGGAYDAKFDLQIEPGNGVANQYSYLQYRSASGGTVTDNLGNTYDTGIITDPSAFYTFKLTVTAAAEVGMANIQAYYYDENTSSYVDFPGGTDGANRALARVGTGNHVNLLSSLSINSRNGSSTSIRGGRTASNAAEVDEVVVTQDIPEPASAGLLLGVLATSLAVVRRRRS
jgi:hypothetical protein